MKISAQKKRDRQKLMGTKSRPPATGVPVPRIEIECPDGVWRRNVPNPPRPVRWFTRLHRYGYGRYQALQQAAGVNWKTARGWTINEKNGNKVFNQRRIRTKAA